MCEFLTWCLQSDWYFDWSFDGDPVGISIKAPYGAHKTTSMIHLGLVGGQIYEETKNLQYAHNAFFFEHDAAMRSWMPGRSAMQIRYGSQVLVPRDVTREYFEDNTKLYREMFVELRMLCVDASRLFNREEVLDMFRTPSGMMTRIRTRENFEDDLQRRRRAARERRKRSRSCSL
jgi:hypothetical protein